MVGSEGRTLLLDWQYDGGEDDRGQKGKYGKVLGQTSIARPCGLPVFGIDRTIIRPVPVFEEGKSVLQLDELLLGLPMAVVLLPNQHGKGQG